MDKTLYDEAVKVFLRDYTQFIEMILSVLKDHFPDEYEMLRMLARGDLDSPRHVLDGILYHDVAKHMAQPLVRGHSLSVDQAEYRLDCICSSAMQQVVCSRRSPDIAVAISRAKEKGINFHEVVDPKLIADAGQKEVNLEMRYRVVSTPEYVQFVHSFIRPKWRLENA